jgi:hypothetical protein
MKFPSPEVDLSESTAPADQIRNKYIQDQTGENGNIAGNRENGPR